jgi:hypothetical protein
MVFVIFASQKFINRMKKLYAVVFSIAALTLLCVTQSFAQVVKVDTLTHWRKSFRAGLNLNQANFSSNWKAGGVNSFGFSSFLNIKANHKKDKISWDNEIDLLYGMVNNAGQGYRKTADRIFLDTKLGYGFSKKWNFFVAANAQSQFAKGFKYTKDATGVEQSQLMSESFAPTFITLTLGAEFTPSEFFKLRISPVAPRATILGNNDGRYAAVDPVRPYGVEVGHTTRFEKFAFQILSEFNKDIATNMNLKVRYVMFGNYENLDANLIDHRVDLNLTAKVNRYVNASIGGIFLYDYDQDNSPQYSQAISLGVMYTFQNFEDKK